VQEACLRAFRYFDSYREGDAKSWILKIVRRACYDWIERNRPAEVVPLETDADPEGAVNSAPAALDANGLLETRSACGIWTALSKRSRRRCARRSSCASYMSSTTARSRRLRECRSGR
jgi:DNA-directed RNA polymerase specialized sigma24 family protein